MHKTMTPGEIIDALEKLPQDSNVQFDFCSFVPTSFISYRSFYDCLALGYQERWEKITVAEMLEMCKSSVGETYEGYKGGHYRMDRRTPVYVANYGHSTGTTIRKIKDFSYCVIILTGYEV